MAVIAAAHRGVCDTFGLTDAEVVTLAGVALWVLEITQRVVEDWVTGDRHGEPRGR